jgi:hypothetical protein
MVTTGAGSPEPRWEIRDWLAAAGLFLATASLVLWQNAHVAVLFDLSYILNTATRIALGQMPYRDFPLAHAPLTFLVQAAIVRLTGRVFFHHVLYAASIGGLGSVLAWRIALVSLRGRVRAAWPVALLVAAPLCVLGIYCIVPNPEYDCDCGFWILVAVWMLQRLDGETSTAFGFAAGAALCVPLFFKQNMGLPFLAVAGAAILILLGAGLIRRGKPQSDAAGKRLSEEPEKATSGAKQAAEKELILAGSCEKHTSGAEAHVDFTGLMYGLKPVPFNASSFSAVCKAPAACTARPDIPTLLAVLAGVGVTLAAAVLALHWTAGIGNYLHWTVEYAGRRRLPGFSLMFGVYRDPSLLWTLPCVAVALVLLWVSRRSRDEAARRVGPKLRWARIAAFALMAAPFLFTLYSLFLYDDADERGDSLLALWPLLLVVVAALTIANLIRLRGELSLRAFLPLILLAAIHGTFMSQQLWGSTYAIWPLLALLVAEMLACVEGVAARAESAWFVPALAALISVTLLVCGGFYTASEERLSYAYSPDEPAAHSAFPELAGLATPGPYLAEIDELLRYAQANIPFDDGIVLIPGEEPFYFATGRAPRFPVPFFDPTIDPYSPAEIASLVRSRNIRWLIVKRDVQTKEDPTPGREALMNLLMGEFKMAARLHGYDVYQRR